MPLSYREEATGAVRFVAGNAAGDGFDAPTGGLTAFEDLGAHQGLTQVGDLDLDGRPDLIVGLSSGSVGVYYDVSPLQSRGLDEWDALFAASVDSPIQALDVAPAPNDDATTSVGIGIPVDDGQLYLLRVSGL